MHSPHFATSQRNSQWGRQASAMKQGLCYLLYSDYTTVYIQLPIWNVTTNTTLSFQKHHLLSSSCSYIHSWLPKSGREIELYETLLAVRMQVGGGYCIKYLIIISYPFNP